MKKLAITIFAALLAVACIPALPPAEDEDDVETEDEIVLQGDFDTKPSRAIAVEDFVRQVQGDDDYPKTHPTVPPSHSGGEGLAGAWIEAGSIHSPKVYCTREHVARDELGNITHFETEGPYGVVEATPVDVAK